MCGLKVGGVITVGFFLSFCCGCIGFFIAGATVDLQTEGWEVISHGGDGRVVVLVGDAGIRKVSKLVVLLGKLCSDGVFQTSIRDYDRGPYAETILETVES